jgi:hypothetical protein
MLEAAEKSLEQLSFTWQFSEYQMHETQIEFSNLILMTFSMLMGEF